VYWPTKSKAVPLTELGWSNVIYLAESQPAQDSTMVWGTTVELDHIDDFLATQSRQSNLMISVAHVLIKAVSQSLIDHPRLNRRVIHRRVHPYNGVSIVVPIRRPSDGIVDVVFFQDTVPMSLSDIAGRMWSEARDRAMKIAQEKRQSGQGITFKSRLLQFALPWQLQFYKYFIKYLFAVPNHLRLPTWDKWDQEMNGANAFVNFLGFNGAPPMISYKPSRLGTNSFSVSVTMGIPEQKPVVRDGQIAIAKVAPIFVRADHRLVNGHQLGEFIATLRTYMANPSRLIKAQPDSKTEEFAAAA